MPIVFDFDGVLANSEPIHERAFHDVVDPMGLALSHETFVNRFVGKSDLVCFRMLLDDHGRAYTEEDLLALRRRKTEAFNARVAAGEAEAFPGALDLVRAAAERGPVGVCSGSLSEVVRPVLERFGVADLVRTLVGAERVQRVKPDPEGYLLACRELGAEPSECAAIEDSPTGIRAAKSAGLRCLAVAHSFPAERLDEADAVFGRIGEIALEDLLGSGVGG